MVGALFLPCACLLSCAPRAGAAQPKGPACASGKHCGLGALFVAARNGELALVQWLIDIHGADVNGHTEDGRTALHEARSPVIVRALLERNADPTLIDVTSWTALMHQIRAGRPERVTCVERVVCLLEDQRVVQSVNTTAKGPCAGYTALHFACRTWLSRAPHLSSLIRSTCRGASIQCREVE